MTDASGDTQPYRAPKSGGSLMGRLIRLALLAAVILFAFVFGFARGREIEIEAAARALASTAMAALPTPLPTLTPSDTLTPEPKPTRRPASAADRATRTPAPTLRRATATRPPEIDPAVRQALDTLNTLAVAPEDRCSPYDSDDYPYPRSVEANIVRGMGGRIYGPFSGTTFSSTTETDIEHMVAKSEAHDSGLCAAGDETRKAFARDLLNLTLAAPKLNRHQKSGKDFAEWKPPLNQCWFADRIVKVKAKYRLAIDSREKAALERTLRSCASVEMR